METTRNEHLEAANSLIGATDSSVELSRTLKAPMKDWGKYNTIQREFYVEHILPKNGLMIIGGDTGMGRTWEALHLMASIEKGETWHGLQCYPAKCLYLYMEHGIADAKEKFTKIGDVRGELNSMAIYDDQTNFRLETEEGYQNIKSIGEEAQADVIFLDPLQATYRPQRGRFDPVFWEWWQSVKLLLADYTLVILHNTRKGMILKNSISEDKLSVDMLKCPSELAARSETVIMYAVVKGSRDSVWQEVGRYIGIPKHTASNISLPILKVRWNWNEARYDNEWRISNLPILESEETQSVDAIVEKVLARIHQNA